MKEINDSYGSWMVSKYEISSPCQLPASSRKIPLLKCKAKQSNSVESNSKKSMRANKFSRQPSQRREKALGQGPVQPEWDSHKAWFIRNHWKSYKAHAAFLSPVTNFHFGRNNVFPCSCHLACWFLCSTSVKWVDPAWDHGDKWRAGSSRKTCLCSLSHHTFSEQPF